MIHIRSKVKTRQSQNHKLKKKLQKIQIVKFCKKVHTRHIFWSCLIRCINMKWIQPELYALQNGHGVRDGRTDGRTEVRTDGVKPIYPPRSSGVKKISYDVIKLKHFVRYWPLVTGIHRSPVDSPHKGQWCFLWSAPEQTVGQAIETPVIWDAIALIMMFTRNPVRWCVAIMRILSSLAAPQIVVTYGVANPDQFGMMTTRPEDMIHCAMAHIKAIRYLRGTEDLSPI